MRRSLFLNSTSVAIVALALFAVSVKSREAGKSERPELESKPALITPESVAPKDEVLATSSPDQTELEVDAKVVLLSIRPTGFEPKELTIPTGTYLIVVRNRSGLDEFGFRLELGTGETLYQVVAPRFKRDRKYLAQLTPGSYVIREISHPEWNCRITVTAR